MGEHEHLPFEYHIVDEEVVITKYIGNDTRVRVPEEVNGKEVTKIGDYAFSERSNLTEVILPKTLKCIGAYSFRECRGLTSLELHENISEIQSHAFYNCRGLRALSLNRSDIKVGDGALKNCEQIEEISIHSDSDKVPALKHIIEELPQDLTASICYKVPDTKWEVRLVFPRDAVFYSDFTTRLYNPIVQGSGHRYRLSATNGNIDYERYDSIFAGALSELPDEQLLEITIARLMKPYGLKETYLEQYLAFLKEHFDMALEKAIFCQAMDELVFLLEQHLVTEEQLEEAINYAREKNRVECTQRLLQYKNDHFSKRNQEFDL